MIFTTLSSPRRTVEVAGDHVDLVHGSTDCDQHNFRDSAFLGVAVVNVERHHSEVEFAIAGGSSDHPTRYDGLEYLALFNDMLARLPVMYVNGAHAKV